MKYQATKKIDGGKLVRIKIDADTDINDIQISGDFFLHPEDAINDVQERLRGLSRGSSPDIFSQEISSALGDKKAAFIGVTADDLSAIIVEALQSPRQD